MLRLTQRTLHAIFKPMKRTETEAALLAELKQRITAHGHAVVAIDGNAASGKTTLAAQIAEHFAPQCSVNVFHMDDFFPRLEQRTEERLSQPGENVDHERFWEEVLLPLRDGRPVITYRPYLCAQQQLGQPVTVEAGRIAIVEGSYACHPSLWQHYDLRIFLSVEPDEQMRRIQKRNGPEKAVQFAQRWIPFEEMYFRAFRVQERCDIRLEGSSENRKTNQN